ncbi:MAG: hypothetical protein AAGC70_15235 [Pseudomonadota bacterium]
MQGHISLIGGFENSAAGYSLRLLLFASGMLFLAPGGSPLLPVSHLTLSLAALIIGAPALIWAWVFGRETRTV